MKGEGWRGTLRCTYWKCRADRPRDLANASIFFCLPAPKTQNPSQPTVVTVASILICKGRMPSRVCNSSAQTLVRVSYVVGLKTPQDVRFGCPIWWTPKTLPFGQERWRLTPPLAANPRKFQTKDPGNRLPKLKREVALEVACCAQQARGGTHRTSAGGGASANATKSCHATAREAYGGLRAGATGDAARMHEASEAVRGPHKACGRQ